MDESQARGLLARVADAEIPPSLVNVGLAQRQGRSKLRRRRAAMAGPPALAAVAVAALLLGGVLPPGPGGHHRPAPPTGRRTPPPAVRTFSPLVPYAEFGWLPAGQSMNYGTMGTVSQVLTAGRNARAVWSLTITSEDRCNLSSGQILRRLRGGGHPSFNCGLDRSGGLSVPVSRQLRSVNGHPAFLASGYLIWEYTRDSWALMAGPGTAAPDGTAAKVADGITFGPVRVPAVEFPVQLTGLPRAWRIGSVHFSAHSGTLRALGLDLAGAGAGQPEPGITIGLSAHGGSCFFYPGGQSRRRVINGIKVVVNRIPDAQGGTLQVCAAHAHGLYVFVSTYGHQRPGAVGIFSQHLRLLGTVPANWATSPLKPAGPPQ